MMPAYLINGASTTGKTSVGAELKKRGYEVVDTDQAFGLYANLKTEEPVPFPENGRPDETWYERNGWIWDRKKVNAALIDIPDKPVFFYGGSQNESAFYNRFDKIIRLHVEPEVFLKRIDERDIARHANNQGYKQKMLDFIEQSEKDARKLGWPVIDTSNISVTDTVDKILSHVHDDS